MGRIFDADTIYFDELAVGISAGVNFDDSKNFDSVANRYVHLTMGTTVDETVIFHEVLDIHIKCNIEVDENYANFIDLMKLVPEKFRDSVVLQQFLEEAGVYAGTWTGEINDLVGLLDPNYVSEDYIQYLADLIGLTIQGGDSVTVAEKRRQLIYAIPWYKMKGTYKSLRYIAYLQGLAVNIWDEYTNDYATFVDEDWFVGAEGENPTGLDSTYYKSPHIGIEHLLNTVHGSASDSYLFLGTEFDNFIPYVEMTRPINVVPDYRIFLNPVTDTTGAVTTVDGNIQTCVVGDWSGATVYFDDGHSFDDSEYFDYSDTTMINNVTVWKLGTGSKGIAPANSLFSLENVVLTGTISSVVNKPTYIEYKFYVPVSTVQAGVSELGLYMTGGSILRVASTFPNINLVSGIRLRVVVRINK